MTISDWLMIFAVFTGPLVAVQLTKWQDSQREKRQRKLDIFKTLMATRAYGVSWNHVQALNSIDLEFERSVPAEREVIDSWKAYLDHLNTKAVSQEHWVTRRIELMTELLHKMAAVLGYDFDKTHIKNASYAPIAHGDLEQQQQALRQLSIEVLQGHRTVSVRMENEQNLGPEIQTRFDTPT